jgi:hypothetical protein
LKQPAKPGLNDWFVSVDAGGIFYSLTGKPVAFLSDQNGLNGNVVDLKFTDDSTITFLHKDGYETDLGGHIFWKTPNDGKVSGDTAIGEIYHHEFRKLKNGHYMTLGLQLMACYTVSERDSMYIKTTNQKPTEVERSHLGRFGSIIEYDRTGKIAWSWNAAKYLLGSDFDYANGLDSNIRFDPHDNSFYFDDQSKDIYVSFKHINRVMKIKYPSGAVEGIYGHRYHGLVPDIGGDVFCNQHGIKKNSENNLYFFNNNTCQIADRMPNVMIVNEPSTPGDSMKVVWQYTCSIDASDYPENYPKRFGNGGNVNEMPDGSLFVNMGSEYSKLFIITKSKEILWAALPQRFMETDGKWTTIKEYRANILNRSSLEKLVWKSELDNLRFK